MEYKTYQSKEYYEKTIIPQPNNYLLAIYTENATPYSFNDTIIQVETTNTTKYVDSAIKIYLDYHYAYRKIKTSIQQQINDYLRDSKPQNFIHHAEQILLNNKNIKLIQTILIKNYGV